MIRRPLSADQERQWLVDLLVDDDRAATDPTVVRLVGPLSMAALHDAWTALTARHDSLRTGFPTSDGVASQVIHDSLPRRLPIGWVDLTEGEPPTGAALGRAIDSAARLPFDSSSPPLWRVLVVRTSAEDHVLALTLHHLIADLWSVTVVIDEFCTLYSAALDARPLRLPASPAQPVELAARGAGGPRRRAALTSWWREQLAGAEPVVLPTLVPRSHLPRLSSCVHESALPAALSDALRAAARGAGTTLLPVLLSGFAALVGRWSGASDITVVSVFAGRRGRDTERTVGLLTECLVLRLDLDGDPEFRELVRRSTEVVIDALDHAAVPFVDLVSIADPARDREPSPLRQLGLSLHNVPAARPGLAGVTAAPPPPTPRRDGTSEADIWLEVFDQGRGPLGLRLQMDDLLFDTAVCADFTGSFTALLTAAARDGGVRVSRLPVTGPPAGARTGRASLHETPPTHRDPMTPDPATPDPATLDAVVRCVSELLALESPPGEDDNVFLLGGTSIDMSRLGALLLQRCGVTVGLYELMTASTLAGVARAVEAATGPVTPSPSTGR